MKAKDILVIGHAGKTRPEAVTVDIDPAHQPDVVWDLNKTPWPFEADSFREIDAHHVLEHLNELSSAMKEMHRICQPDGVIRIEVPHHTAWFAKDPAHRMFFGPFSFDGFIQGNATWVTGEKFVCSRKEVTFHRLHRMFFLHKLFNTFPLAYERFFCYMFPAEHVKVWLSPVKK